MRLLLRCLPLVMLGMCLPALAQRQLTAQDIRASVARFQPLKFSATPQEEIGAFTDISNVVFKPKGDGPFPAIVLIHTCGGIKDAHMRDHAKDLLARGFVVLPQDSFNPRGRVDCGPGMQNRLPTMLGVRDAYDALNHLESFPFVDKARIYQAGYSYGGFVATFLASSFVAEVFGAQKRFRATIANYSPCKYGNYDIILPSTDRPVLMLLGEKDDETPAASCFPVLEELKAAGKPVQWHVLPGATHGWDKQGEGRNGYFYNRETTQEATRRMLEFIAQNP